jgi:hypothetical protein
VNVYTPTFVYVCLSIYLSPSLRLCPFILSSLLSLSHQPYYLRTLASTLTNIFPSVLSAFDYTVEPVRHTRLLLCLSAHSRTLPSINLLPTHQLNVKLILPQPNSSTPSCPYRTLEYIKSEWVGVAVTLLIRTREMFGSNLG